MMDERDLIRSFRYDDAAPSPVARAAARERLVAEIARDLSVVAPDDLEAPAHPASRRVFASNKRSGRRSFASWRPFRWLVGLAPANIDDRPTHERPHPTTITAARDIGANVGVFRDTNGDVVVDPPHRGLGQLRLLHAMEQRTPALARGDGRDARKRPGGNR